MNKKIYKYGEKCSGAAYHAEVSEHTLRFQYRDQAPFPFLNLFFLFLQAAIDLVLNPSSFVTIFYSLFIQLSPS